MTTFKELPASINGFIIVKDLGMCIKPQSKFRLRYCKAICKKCGREFTASTGNLKLNKIGCSKECSSDVGGNARLHKIFGMMKERCYKPSHKSYKNYGAKGIKICEIWLNKSSSFYLWATRNGYSDDLTIDRIDSSKGYYPSNCRWVDKSIQSQNSRQAKLDPQKIRLIRELCTLFQQKNVAKLFNVSVSLISGIVKKERWSNIK